MSCSSSFINSIARTWRSPSTRPHGRPGRRGSGALFFLVLLFAGSVPAQEQAPNNCHNPASWADWDARVTQHPADTELQTLHALWLGLCLKVDRGEVTLGEATTLFEQA